MDENYTVLICEDSGEGIFSAIYLAYEKKLKPENTTIELLPEENYRLFTRYIRVETDKEKAEKVNRTIIERFGNMAVYYIWCCIYSCQREKADIIYHVIARGLANKCGKELIHELQDPNTLKLSQIQKNVSNEAHHFKGFLRFSERGDGILFSKICPKNQVLPLISSHFEDRFNNEYFMIYDEKHKTCLLHQPQSSCIHYYPGEEELRTLEQAEESLSEEEDSIRRLFRSFHETITIDSRRNPKLQRNLLPLRFRGNMVEFE